MTKALTGPVTRPSLLLRLRDSADEDSWRAFTELYGPIIDHYCQRRGLQPADAAEITQEVLLQVSRSIKRFDYRPDRGRFRSWLRTVTRNQLYRFWKLNANAPEQLAGLEDACTGSEDGWDDAFDRQILSAALRKTQEHFEDMTWRVFEMVWLHDVPAPRVAAQLEIPIDHVYVAKSRCLKRLKHVVGDLVDQHTAVDL